MKVTPNFHKLYRFTINNGWELRTWIISWTIENKTDAHKVNYLIHTVTVHIITR